MTRVCGHPSSWVRFPSPLQPETPGRRHPDGSGAKPREAAPACRISRFQARLRPISAGKIGTSSDAPTRALRRGSVVTGEEMAGNRGGKMKRLARAVRARWRPLLAGGVLTVVGGMLHGAWGVVFLPGLLFLLSAPLVPARPTTDRVPRAELERGLGVFSHPAQRRLASQAIALYDKQFPGL